MENYVQHYMAKRRKRKRWQKVIILLGIIVVFCTIYAMISPAITLGKKTYSDSIEQTGHTESASYWEQTTSIVELTGVWSDDLVSIAESQLGYTESTENYEVQSDGSTIKGYTRYGDWYGNEYGDWCAMFVSFCLHYADISSEYVPYDQSCSNWVKQLTANEIYAEADSGYAPEKGDIIFFDYDDDGLADSVGIVSTVSDDGKTINAIEGDNCNSVVLNTYSLTDSCIFGYGVLPDNLDKALHASITLGNETESTIEYTAEDGVTVTVSGDLPEDANIKLTKVTEDTLADILEQVGGSTTVFAYDITIVDVDGNEWQPDELGVTVSISGLSMPESEIEVVHVPDEGNLEQVQVQQSEDALEFNADGFSIYVGYTVDFHYGSLVYSMAGEDCVYLSEIFEQLGIEEEISEMLMRVFSKSPEVPFRKTVLVMYLGSFPNIKDAVLARKKGEEKYEEFIEWYYSTYPRKCQEVLQD